MVTLNRIYKNDPNIHLDKVYPFVKDFYEVTGIVMNLTNKNNPEAFAKLPINDFLECYTINDRD